MDTAESYNRRHNGSKLPISAKGDSFGGHLSRKVYLLTFLAFDLVAICLVFFFSSCFSYSYTTAHKIFSPNGVTQKRERGLITNFTLVYLLRFSQLYDPFFFPYFLMTCRPFLPLLFLFSY
jgi:hypothetical protein